LGETLKSSVFGKSLNAKLTTSLDLRRNEEMTDDFLDDMMTAAYEYENSRRNCPETGEFMPGRTRRDASKRIEALIVNHAQEQRKK
jgi:hypothetical protein